MPIETFEQAFQAVISDGLEGSSFSPQSPQGDPACRYGIEQAEYDQERTSLRLPMQSVEFITLDEARAIYKPNYWDKFRCGDLPINLNFTYFQWVVNSYEYYPTKHLQQCLASTQNSDLKIDGVMGQKTVDACNHPGLFIPAIITCLLKKQSIYYQTSSSPVIKADLKGLLARIDHTYNFCT